MATAATAPRKRRPPQPSANRQRALRSRAGRGQGKARADLPQSKRAGGVASAVERVGEARKAARTANRVMPGKAGSLLTLWRLARLGRRLLKRQLPAATEGVREGTETLLASTGSLRELSELVRDRGVLEIAEALRTVPVQVAIDVAVPVAVAFDEWMALDSLPEGDHRVRGIERARGGRLSGTFSRAGSAHEWEAEVRDERRDESFAWRSVRGSDVAGLITFHRLGERLTRLELQLDIVPVSAPEALALALRISDRMAEAELRRFKSRLEVISPDAYPARVKRTNRRAAERKSGADGRKTNADGPKTNADGPKTNADGRKTNADGPKRSADGRAGQGKARDRQSRNQRKER